MFDDLEIVTGPEWHVDQLGPAISFMVNCQALNGSSTIGHHRRRDKCTN
jgi:hypothetical protein